MRRLATIEIEGAGTFQIRGLTKRQMTRIATRHPADADAAMAVVRAGLVKPKSRHVYGEDESLDALIDRLATEITARSWPKVEI